VRFRVVFLGTPEFAVPSLRALASAGHDIAAVYTQPPRPAGRGYRERKSPVHQAAEKLELVVRTPVKLRDEATQRAFAALEPDVGIVVAYGILLPPAIVSSPRLGCVNLHASLLPRWRGAAPLQHAILAGDQVHGFTLMKIDEGLDTGPILLQQEVNVGPRPTVGALHDVIAQEGAQALAVALDDLADGRPPLRPQPEDGVTLAPKIAPEHRRLDWTRDAAELDRQVRAFALTPGAWFMVKGERLLVLLAESVDETGSAGTVLAGLTIACGSGALRVLRVQRPGKRPMKVDEFLRGFSLPPGTVLNGNAN